MYIESLSGTLLYLTAFFVIFAENGIFFLFFLPGDSLLFALGLLANQGELHLIYLIPLLIFAAIAGNSLGYFLGAIARKKIISKHTFPWLNQNHLERARLFYDKHGILAIFFARFVPVIRTILPFFAGVVSMRKKTFALWSVLGGIVWILTVVLIGYFFGKEFNIHQVGKLGVYVVVLAIVATPVFLGMLKRFIK